MVNAVVQKGPFVKDRVWTRIVESLVNLNVAGDGGPLIRKGLCVVLTPTALAFSAIALMDVVNIFRGLERSERHRRSRKGLKYYSSVNKRFIWIIILFLPMELIVFYIPHDPDDAYASCEL